MLTQNQQNLLQQEKAISLLKEREERYAYYGILQEYQMLSKSEILKLDYTKLNPHQHFLFKRSIHGFNVYTKAEIKAMDPVRKKKIYKAWRKGQTVLNQWKQTIVNKCANNYFKKVFGDDALAITSIPETEYLDDYVCTLTLKDLGITYEDVILKFIQVKLLPKNFLALK